MKIKKFNNYFFIYCRSKSKNLWLKLASSAQCWSSNYRLRVIIIISASERKLWTHNVVWVDDSLYSLGSRAREESLISHRMQRPTSHHAMAHRSLHIAPAVRGVVFRGVRERHWRRGMRCDLYSVQGDPLSNVAHWPNVKGKTRALRQREPARSRKNCATAELIVSIVAAITANNWAAGALHSLL